MINLYPHQKDALEKIKDKNKVAIYYDMGLGKTFIGSEKMMDFGTSFNLVIVQKSKVDDWIEHFKTHYSDFPYMTEVHDLTNKKEYERFINRYKESQEHYTSYFDDWVDQYIPDDSIDPCQYIGVINYDLVWRREELLKLKDFTLMLDESSLIQNESSKRTKFISKLSATNIILLSGTPCSGKYENLYSQAKLLGWNITKTEFWDRYIRTRDIPGNGFPIKIVVGYRNVDDLKDKLREHGAIFLKTEEVLDLPEQTNITIKCDRTKEYIDFTKSFYIKIDGKELIGETTLTKMLYLRQLASAYNQNKINSLKELIESTSDRLIIFYNFNIELEILKKVCKDRPLSFINGTCKDLENYENCDDSITLCQYQSASKGLNLQKANKIIYFSLPLSCENWLQSRKRIHRINQTKPCFYYYLITKNSIDEKIFKTLEKGKDYTNFLFVEDFNE